LRNRIKLYQIHSKRTLNLNQPKMKNRLPILKNFFKLWTIALILFFGASTGVYAQILTFEFAGLAGSEISAISNTSNPGLTTSTITRGPGLLQGANADRFNATSWATLSIANAVSGNDYMEFIITPQTNFQFTVTSIVVFFQRSGTGPSQLALRSSLDSYTTNLDAVKVIVDNTNTQSFTFTFTQAASTTPVTYRFYAFAEAIGGSGGFETAIPAGNDIIVNGTVTSISSTTAPVVSTTAPATAITSTQATAGGDVTSDGGDAVTSRGVVWGTAANPTVPSANSSSNGTGTGIFASTISPLIANTAYNYRAYAANGVGTSYGANSTFTTLPLPPTANAANSVTASSFNATLAAPTMGAAAYTYSIEVSETNTFAVLVFNQSGISSASSSIAVNPPLSSSTDYYYRIRSVNSQGASAWSNIVGPVTTLTPLGPIVATTPITGVTSNAATLNGTIDANGTTANAFFDYGLTIAYGTSVAATPASVTGTGDTDISFNIASGLTPNTLYNYRARANAGVFGANRTFVTLAAVPGAITFGTPTSTTITINSFAVNGNPASTEFAIASNTFPGQFVQFNGTLGAIPFYQTASNWLATTVPGLSSSTSYSFEVIARNSDGISTVSGPSGSSITAGCVAPLIVLSNISNNAVTITLSNSTGNFEYIVNTSAAAPVIAGTAVTGSTIDATGLSASTAYYAHVRSVCGSNFSSWTSTPFSTLANPIGLVTYLFTGCTSCASSAATTADAGVTATNYIRGSGIATATGSDIYNNSGFNIVSPSFASADALGEYVSFTVAANPGFQVTYSSLSFFHQRSGSGPGNTRVGYSTNGGTTWTYMTPDPVFLSGSATVTWNFPTAFSTANTVLFRVWAWGATNAGGAYRNDNVILSGYVSTICNSPVTQSTDVIFSNETNTSTDISWTTAGTSDIRKVFISNTATGSPTLADGTDYSPNTNFGSGDNVGAWYCIYSGTGNIASVSNLLPGQTYRVFVANANCAGIDIHYLNSTAVGNPANVVTTNVPSPLLSSGPLSGFGSTCINRDVESVVIISGSVLNGTNVTVTAPAGFALTLVSGENYTPSVNIPYTGGAFSTPVYVRFLPTVAIPYSSNLSVTGGGATAISVPVSGTGISVAPSVSTGSASFIGTTGATLAGSLTLGCANVFSAYGIEYSVSPAFIPGNGAIVQSAFTGNNFSVPITNLAINTVYYYRAYGINNAVTYYGVVGSFSTLSGAVETIYNYGDNTTGAPFYVHPTTLGSNVLKSSTGWTNSTPCGSGYSGFGITSAATTFNAATNAYVEATITPNVIGNQVEIHRISVQLRSSATAANQVMMAYSIDEGATWINRGVAETPAIGTACGVTTSNSWLLASPVTVGSPLAANSFRIRLYYYNTSGAVLGNNQILNLVVLGRILQSPNTYYTVSGGNFTDAIWSPSASGTVGAQVDFTPEINAVINNGDNVILNASDVLVKSLTIQSGANLKAASTDFSNMRNVSIYENLSVIGSIGNGTAFDAIGLNIEGSNTVISGGGLINVGRIRKQSNFNETSNLTIQSNMNVRFPGAAIYNNAANSFFNVTLPAGRTLNVTGSGGTDGSVTIDGTSDNDIDQKAGSLTINGTLNITGDLSVSSSNNINPYLSSLIIGSTGLVTVKNIDTKINAVNTTTIAAGGRLNVSGIMKQRQGTLIANGGISLGVGAILLHGAGTPGIAPDPGGFITGNIRIRAQGTTAAGVYNYWSSPVAGATLNTIMQNGGSTGSGFNTYKYVPSGATGATVSGLRAGWSLEVSSSIMSPGLGYITTTAGSVQFNGTPNNGNILVTALHGAFTDFNLVGNPYPGPIDAATFMAANQASNIIPALYFWDDDATLGVDYATNDYIVTNAVGTVGTGGNGGAGSYLGRIATGQSFFVESRTAASTINFDNSMRTSGSATFFETPSSFEKLWLRVTSDNNLSNEALLAFGSQATDGYDDLFDAKKIAANADIALYTTSGDMSLAIQAMGALTDSKIVPIGFDAAQAGTYAFSIANMEGINPTVLIYLEDRATGTFHNLRVSDYNVAIEAGINGSDRFFLHFSKAIEVIAHAETCADNDGSIQIAANAQAWNYIVKTAENTVVANGVIESTDQTISDLSEGVYVIEFNFEGYSTSITTEVVASAPILASVSGTSSVSVNEQATFAAISNGATSFTWDFGDGSTIAQGNLVDHTFYAPGIYVVTLYASNGICSSQSMFEVVVDQDVTGLAQVQGNDIRIYPNPANEVVTLVSDGIGMILITDLTGKVITQKSLNMERVVNIATSEFANGVYLVQMLRQGATTTRKLIIAH